VAEELPSGWLIEICVENGAGWAVGHDPAGNERNTESPLPDAIIEILEQAKKEWDEREPPDPPGWEGGFADNH